MGLGDKAEGKEREDSSDDSSISNDSSISDELSVKGEEGGIDGGVIERQQQIRFDFEDQSNHCRYPLKAGVNVRGWKIPTAKMTGKRSEEMNEESIGLPAIAKPWENPK